MRVENNLANTIAVGAAVGGSVAHVGSRTRIPGAEEDGSPDTVRLSHASDLVALARGAQPADRQARIASLAEQVRNGTYQVDASAVSHALVNSLK